MIILMEHAWIWIIFGGVLAFWGYSEVGLSPSQWISFLFKLIFNPFTDDTKLEKRQLQQPIEQVASVNPGCFLMLIGFIMGVYGMIHVFT